MSTPPGTPIPISNGSKGWLTGSFEHDIDQLVIQIKNTSLCATGPARYSYSATRAAMQIIETSWVSWFTFLHKNIKERSINHPSLLDAQKNKQHLANPTWRDRSFPITQPVPDKLFKLPRRKNRTPLYNFFAFSYETANDGCKHRSLSQTIGSLVSQYWVCKSTLAPNATFSSIKRSEIS